MAGQGPGNSDDNEAVGPDSSDPVDPESVDGALTSSLAGLGRLATGRLDLTEMLTRVAGYAVDAIPGADGAGLTLLEDNRADTIVATADFVQQVDDIQYTMGEGPCISAARESRTFTSGSLGGEQRWPRFGPRVARLGVHSVLSLPLVTPDGVFGAMNIYAHAKGAFDEHSISVGELFSVPAAIAVQNAQVLAQARRLATNLQAALASRAVIDQAMGIVMSRTGCTAPEAFERLKARSQAEHVKVFAVAESVVDAAVRRARSRRGPDGPPPVQ